MLSKWGGGGVIQKGWGGFFLTGGVVVPGGGVIQKGGLFFREGVIQKGGLFFRGGHTKGAFLPYCDKATMVDAKTHLLYPQYMRPSVTLCLLCVRAVTTPQRWMIRPTCNTRQSSAAVLVLSGPACAKLLPFTGMSLLPALLPCCDKATMVDAKTHLLYPQYMRPCVTLCLLCVRAVTTPQRWMIRPTCNTCWLLSSLFPFDLPIEDQHPLATWPCCGFGRSWCTNVRRCRIHPSQRQSSAAVPLLSGSACAELLPFTGMSLLPALLSCCDKATMVDAKTHLLYPQYMYGAPLLHFACFASVL